MARALAPPAADHLRRRAHRQPRLPHRHRDPHVHAQGGRRAAPDHRDGDPRSQSPPATPTACCSSPTASIVDEMVEPDCREGARQDEGARRLTPASRSIGSPRHVPHRPEGHARPPAAAVHDRPRSIVLGVAFISGTAVLSDLLQSSGQRARSPTSYRGVDGVVRSSDAQESAFSTVPTRAQADPGVDARPRARRRRRRPAPTASSRRQPTMLDKDGQGDPGDRSPARSRTTGSTTIELSGGVLTRGRAPSAAGRGRDRLQDRGGLRVRHR